MSTGYKIIDQGTLHYVTFHVVHWVDLFIRKVYRDIVHYTLQNRVVAEIVKCAEDYRYSSAIDYAGGQGLLEVMVV